MIAKKKSKYLPLQIDVANPFWRILLWNSLQVLLVLTLSPSCGSWVWFVVIERVGWLTWPRFIGILFPPRISEFWWRSIVVPTPRTSSIRPHVFIICGYYQTYPKLWCVFVSWKRKIRWVVLIGIIILYRLQSQQYHISLFHSSLKCNIKCLILLVR